MEPACKHINSLRVNEYSVYLGDDEKALGIDTGDHYTLL